MWPLKKLLFIWIGALLLWTPEAVKAAPKSVYFHTSVDQIEGSGLEPVEKMISLIASHPKSRYVRFAVRFTAMRADITNNFRFDRKTETITFHSAGRINGRIVKWYYRFYHVNAPRLRRWAIASNRQDNTYGRDMDIFLLLDVGSQVKDLRSGKYLSSREDFPQ